MRIKRWIVAIGAALLPSVPALMFAMEPPGNQPSPLQPANPDEVWLRQVTWTEDEREQYYHLANGTQLIPYNWFLALEQADTSEPFKSDDHMKQLLLVPDEAHPLHNPDKLPVGFTKTEFPNDPREIKEYLGITCAFCHTGELHVTTKDRRRLTIYIDGGASMQNNPKFLGALIASLRRTAADDDKFSRFASAVLKEWNNEESKRVLKAKLCGLTDILVARARPEVQQWGVGRFDALNRGSNLVFMPLDRANEHPLDAPVSIPPLWNVHLYDWVQWNGSIQNPLARNIAQVIGIGAGLFQNPPFQDPQDPKKLLLLSRPPDPFASSLDIEKLQRLEHMVSTIKPPRWPEKVFGEIDAARAKEGKRLYRDNCKHCHVPKALPSPSPFGQRFKMNLIPAEEIGTNSLYLESFSSRTVRTGVLEHDFESPSSSAAKASEFLTTTLIKRSLSDTGPNTWETWASFMARPHAGVWATPPFLHNGSIPNVYELLSPVEERTTCFYLGDLEYDPIKIGYALRKCSDGEVPGGFKFDTAQPGNSHIGHEFRKNDRAGHVFTRQECEAFRHGGKNGILGCEFSPEQRSAIIEYLKTCDLDDVTWDERETPKICKARRIFFPE